MTDKIPEFATANEVRLDSAPVPSCRSGWRLDEIPGSAPASEIRLDSTPVSSCQSELVT
jgi:hypothetical protein